MKSYYFYASHKNYFILIIYFTNVKKIYIALLVLFVIGGVGSCQKKEVINENQIVLSWVGLTLHLLKNTPANTPTFASRTLGYIGLSMYESVVQGFEGQRSMNKQLNGLNTLPQKEKDKKYSWIASLNAAQAEILRSIYIQTSDANKVKIDSLEQLIYEKLKAANHEGIELERSTKFGKEVAKQIFEWSKTDSGHRAYLRNFDKKMVFEQKKGSWQPPLYAQSFSHFPLHPHWGKNRTFLSEDANIAAPNFIPYSEEKNSPYYQQFWEVYQKEKTLTQEEKEVAIWWGDDPDETYTPPGHSYFLASLVIKAKNPPLIKSAETFARVGMAVADAFINCWKWKYQFFSERPNTYITKHIDSTWVSFWPDPPFPAFPSGHAIQAAAAATVLIDLYGEKFSFTDSLHQGRRKDDLRNVDFKTRTFDSFWQVAEETANSRFYGGIHTRQDNQAGLEKGKEIGENINKLKWGK
ncbi:MAG: phosphatase PAP2 family protein [Cytophagales bacterium]|nr:MAG: phosphatase PAP2 family protein [Cytophagales bacterium]